MLASRLRWRHVRWSRWGGVALIAGTYAGFAGAAHLVGFRMRIPWGYFQLLDGRTLLAHPLGSLCYLHSQPPGLNTLLAIVLRVAAALAVPAEQVAAAFFLGLGFLGTLALAHVTKVVTGSRLVVALAVVAMLADPGFHVYGHLFFYEFLDYAVVFLLLAVTARYLAHGRRAEVVAVAVVTAALPLIRTLFHPLWAVGYCALVIALRRRLAPDAREWRAHGVLAAAVLLPILFAWPLKNLLVYGRFTTASMTGVSLSRAVPGCGSLLLNTFLGTGVAPDNVLQLAAGASTMCGSAAQSVATSPTKSGGSRNWNHVAFLAAAPELTRCGTAWRLGNPVAWLSKAAGQYVMWTRPTFVHPYDGKLVGPADARWIGYATTYERAAFFDLRSTVERLLPVLFLHREAMLRRRPVPYTLFGFVSFPLILGLAAWQQTRCPWNVRTATAAAALLCLLWPMLGACLTDGQEGNRMRFSTTPALLVVVICLVGEALARRPRHEPGLPPVLLDALPASDPRLTIRPRPPAGEERLDQSRLADPRLAAHEEDLPRAARGLLKAGGKGLELGVAAGGGSGPPCARAGRILDRVETGDSGSRRSRGYRFH